MATELTIDWGTDDTLDTTISHLLLGPAGLTGYTFKFYAKKSKSDADADAFISKTPTATTLGSTTVDGIVSTPIADIDTSGLPRYTTVLFWRLIATDGSGKDTVPDEGTLIVRVN